MNNKLCAAFAAVGVGILSLSQVQAADMTMGQFEFENSCATCHGASGKGDGPAAQFFLGGAAPDLTALQKNNGGVFPVQSIYDVIEGSRDTIVASHGSRAMPMWGQRYMQRTEEGLDFDPLTEEQKDIYVRTRILSLIEYLSTIQEE
jgi:mono/diheme cytochrome c family protein